MTGRYFPFLCLTWPISITSLPWGSLAQCRRNYSFNESPLPHAGTQTHFMPLEGFLRHLFQVWNMGMRSVNILTFPLFLLRLGLGDGAQASLTSCIKLLFHKSKSIWSFENIYKCNGIFCICSLA